MNAFYGDGRAEIRTIRITTLKVIVALIAILCFCAAFSVSTAYAASDDSLSYEDKFSAAQADTWYKPVSRSINGSNNQSEARKILSLVNQARTAKSAKALTWDYDLEKIAMQRAAELSVYYEHTRPNGGSCYDLTDGSYYTFGENIHFDTGKSTASTANKAWTNSSAHYQNMIDKEYTCMAAAMFTVKGTTYWVELFADPNQNTSSTSAVNGSRTYSVEALSSLVNGSQGSAFKLGWVKSGNRWWYRDYDGTYPKDGLKIIDDEIYCFDSNGWMKTGWVKQGSKWYYFGKSGALQTGWKKVSGKWYYLSPRNATMQTGRQAIDGKTYFLGGNGAMCTGWVEDGSNWYYTNKSGVMVTGWQKVKSKWYYLDPADGTMLTGKKTIDGSAYFLTSSGAMKTGWNEEGSNWYYYNKSGVMKTNAWISGKYWVGSDGIMATNTWVDGDRYYVDGNGAWVKGAQR